MKNLFWDCFPFAFMGYVVVFWVLLIATLVAGPLGSRAGQAVAEAAFKVVVGAGALGFVLFRTLIVVSGDYDSRGERAWATTASVAQVGVVAVALVVGVARSL
jgi:hypothetical protein